MPRLGSKITFLYSIYFYFLDQDEFRSEPVHNQEISYTLPSFDEIGSPYGLAEDWFERYDGRSFYGQISAGGNTLQCAELNNCRIVPHWSYTPIWSGMSPSVVYPG